MRALTDLEEAIQGIILEHEVTTAHSAARILGYKLAPGGLLKKRFYQAIGTLVRRGLAVRLRDGTIARPESAHVDYDLKVHLRWDELELKHAKKHVAHLEERIAKASAVIAAREAVHGERVRLPQDDKDAN